MRSQHLLRREQFPNNLACNRKPAKETAILLNGVQSVARLPLAGYAAPLTLFRKMYLQVHGHPPDQACFEALYGRLLTAGYTPAQDPGFAANTGNPRKGHGPPRHRQTPLAPSEAWPVPEVSNRAAAYRLPWTIVITHNTKFEPAGKEAASCFGTIGRIWRANCGPPAPAPGLSGGGPSVWRERLSEKVCWGGTSIVRVLGPEPTCSDQLRDFIHSSALDLN